MGINHKVSYDVLLDMISSFQWVPGNSCLRLAVGQSVDHAVLRTLNQLAGEIAYATASRSVGNTQIIMEVFSRRPDLLYAGTCGEVIAGANQIVEFVGVGPDLIGVGNLYCTAFALTIRKKVPRRWNDFCEHIDKPSWQMETQADTASDASFLGGPPVATMGADDVLGEGLDEIREDGLQPTPPEDGMAANTSDDKGEGPAPVRRGGLAAAFDDVVFNERADRLLNRHQEEDHAASHTVISVPESMPTKCSPFHSVIQEKQSAVRTGHKGGKK